MRGLIEVLLTLAIAALSYLKGRRYSTLDNLTFKREAEQWRKIFALTLSYFTPEERDRVKKAMDKDRKRAAADKAIDEVMQELKKDSN